MRQQFKLEGTVKTTAESIEGCQVILNIEVEPEELENSLNQAYRRLVFKVAIPGFRKGKAPRYVMERYLGRDALLDEALERLFPQLYEKALEEQGIEAIAQPQVELTQRDPVAFKITVPTRPVVELGDYRQLRLSSGAVEVGEEEINEVLQRLQHLNALWQPVERAVRPNDLVAIDIEGRVDDKIVLSEKGQGFHLTPGSLIPVPGFVEKLEGMEKGEEREFALTIPSDYANPELAAKECHFKVSVSEIKEEQLPELNDEFAQSLVQESLELLREKISADLRARKEAEARGDLEEKVIDAVVAMSHIEYPPILVEQEQEHLLSAYRERLGGERGMQDYLKLAGKGEEEFRDELRARAERAVIRSLILDKVREVENIEVGDPEVDAEVEGLALGAGENGDRVRELFSTPSSRDSLRGELAMKKTMERLIQIATAVPSGEETELSGDEG